MPHALGVFAVLGGCKVISMAMELVSARRLVTVTFLPSLAARLAAWYHCTCGDMCVDVCIESCA